MNKIFPFGLISIIIVYTSCSDPLERKYSDKTFENDATAIKNSKKLSDSDATVLATYIIQAKTSGKNIEGVSYSEMLREAKEIERERKELAEKVAREEAQKAARIAATLT